LASKKIHCEKLYFGFENLMKIDSPKLANTKLWEHLKMLLLKDCRWFLSGNFNMVEAIEDNSSTCGRMLQGIEKLTLKVLKEFLNVESMPILMATYDFHGTTLKRNTLLLGSLRSYLLNYY